MRALLNYDVHFFFSFKEQALRGKDHELTEEENVLLIVFVPCLVISIVAILAVTICWR